MSAIELSAQRWRHRRARGIGYATAKAFVDKGAQVFIGDLDADLAKAAAAELGCTGTGLDVRSRESSPSSWRVSNRR